MGRAHHHEVSAAMSAMLESLLTPAQRAQADRIDAAMVQLSGLLAERAVLETATRAIDVSRRAAFEAIHQDHKPARVIRDDGFDDDQFTSTQPLGDASVRVVYSFDGTDLSIDGAQVGDQFIAIDFFTSQVRGDWYRAIRAEESLASASDKAAAAASWGDQ